MNLRPASSARIIGLIAIGLIVIGFIAIGFISIDIATTAGTPRVDIPIYARLVVPVFFEM